MNRIKPYIYVSIALVTFIILSKSFVVLVGNITTLFRGNNINLLDEKMYKLKIENLEKELANYERAYAGYKIYESSSYILAKTSIRKVYDFYDYIIIAPTSKVNEGTAVINENGLVGMVSEATNKTAKVTLLTGIKNLSVKVTNSYGLLNGYDKKENLLIIKNINNYEEISIGDEVYTSGLEGIQAGLSIGEVVKTKLEGVERIVYVRSYVDFDDINYVYVINK